MLQRTRQSAVKIASAWKAHHNQQLEQQRRRTQAATLIQRSMKDWVDKAKAAVVIQHHEGNWRQRSLAAVAIGRWGSRLWKRRKRSLSKSPKSTPRNARGANALMPTSFFLDSFSSSSSNPAGVGARLCPREAPQPLSLVMQEWGAPASMPLPPPPINKTMPRGASQQSTQIYASGPVPLMPINQTKASSSADEKTLQLGSFMLDGKVDQGLLLSLDDESPFLSFEDVPSPSF